MFSNDARYYDTLVSEGFIPGGGAIVDFSRWWSQAFFQGAQFFKRQRKHATTASRLTPQATKKHGEISKKHCEIKKTVKFQKNMVNFQRNMVKFQKKHCEIKKNMVKFHFTDSKLTWHRHR